MRQQIDGFGYRDLEDDVEIGTDSTLVGRQVTVGSGTRIGKAVSIEADDIHIGRNCVIEDGVKVSWRRGVPRLFQIGDCSFIGGDSKLLVAELATGDYVTLHNHLLATGDSRLSIGHNTWVGQNCVLNANAALKIGNGVGIGTYSSIWTHGQYAEKIEGCLLHKVAPVVIEDDVWMVGAYNVISPGVTVGRRAVILTGSVITKDVEPYSCYGGSPARDLSGKIETYRNVTIGEKFEMMTGFVSEFLEKEFSGRYTRRNQTEYLVDSMNSGIFRLLVKWEITDQDIPDGTPVMAVTVRNSLQKNPENATVFDLSDKTYTKRLSDQEIRFMRFLLDARARFNPR